MRKIILALAAFAGIAAFAVPATASAASAAPAVVPCPGGPDVTPGVNLHFRLANCTGGLPGDLGRGIRITATGAVQLRTSNLANLRITHRDDTLANPGDLVTFRIKYGTKFLRVNGTGAHLSGTPMLFGMYPGPGWNGPRPIYRASADGGPPLAGSPVLTADGIVLKLAPVWDPAGIDPPDFNQIWAVYQG